MQRHAFKMFLNPGQEAEYIRRHDAIWPELVGLLQGAGISNYSIHLDRETGVLFGYLERRDDHGMDGLPDHPCRDEEMVGLYGRHHAHER